MAYHVGLTLPIDLSATETKTNLTARKTIILIHKNPASLSNASKFNMIFKLTERDLQTKYGTFREILYYDGQKESIALVMGEVENGEDLI